MVTHSDDLKDSFYLYIMRNSVGAGLRTQYLPDSPMPDRLAELMQELDAKEREAKKKQGTEKDGAESKS